MNSENDLIQKLMISKKIMDIHNKTPRSGNVGTDINIPEVESFTPPQASYNIPQEFLSEVRQPSAPIKTNKEIPTEQKIMSSKLPDEIKKLMIEHPIAQPNNMNAGPTLSDELVQKASRLMGTNSSGVEQQPKRTQQTQSSNIDLNTLKSVVRETIEEVLKENGLMIESTTKSSEMITFRVGKHIFEGKVTKVKKVQ